MARQKSFGDLFSKCTISVPGDGDCFLWSAMEEFRMRNMTTKRLREELYQAAVARFGKKYVKANTDYSNIREDKSWVEWAAGAAALSLYTHQPVVIVAPEGSIKAVNGEVEILTPEERNNAISSGLPTIVYHGKHFQPLKNDSAARVSFVEGLNEIDNQRQNTTPVDDKNLPVKQTVEISDKNGLPNMQKDNIQVLYDAIDNAFSDNNRIEARKFVDEILAQTPESEKENMSVILLGGIIAQSEHEPKNKVKPENKRTSILARGKAVEKAVKMKTGILPKDIDAEDHVRNMPQALEV